MRLLRLGLAVLFTFLLVASASGEIAPLPSDWPTKYGWDLAGTVKAVEEREEYGMYGVIYRCYTMHLAVGTIKGGREAAAGEIRMLRTYRKLWSPPSVVGTRGLWYIPKVGERVCVKPSLQMQKVIEANGFRHDVITRFLSDRRFQAILLQCAGG
jgi:hypothetical protein